MVKWEYKMVNLPKGGNTIVDKFNRMGEQGWELVSIIHHSNPAEWCAESDRTEFFALFKKPQ